VDALAYVSGFVRERTTFVGSGVIMSCDNGDVHVQGSATSVSDKGLERSYAHAIKLAVRTAEQNNVSRLTITTDKTNFTTKLTNSADILREYWTTMGKTKVDVDLKLCDSEVNVARSVAIRAVYQGNFTEVIRRADQQNVSALAYTDGSAYSDNSVAFGAIVVLTDYRIYELGDTADLGHTLGQRASLAETYAVGLALGKCNTLQVNRIDIYTDNDLLVKQLNKDNNGKDSLEPYFKHLRSLLKSMNGSVLKRAGFNPAHRLAQRARSSGKFDTLLL
jgi:ribonuclease HI